MTFFAIILAAGSATASDVALKGGMSLIDGTFLTALLTGIASIITAIGVIIRYQGKLRNQESEIRAKVAEELKAKIVNDPLNVKPVPAYVSCEECAAHRATIEKRIDEIGPALNRIFKKLTENDAKSEERANQMHRRIDPLIEKVAAHGAELEILKGKP